MTRNTSESIFGPGNGILSAPACRRMSCKWHTCCCLPGVTGSKLWVAAWQLKGQVLHYSKPHELQVCLVHVVLM